MKVNKVYLINAGNEDNIASTANDSSFPALGVVSLGTVVNHYSPEREVRVYDGQITPLEDIEQAIAEGKPDVLGVSVLGTSYQTALTYAKAAKEAGAITIFGNDQAAVLGRNMLKRREEIDYVCAADVGEFAFLRFLDYLEGWKRVEEVPQLVYRTREGINHNELPEIEQSGFTRWNVLDQIPIPNRKLLPQDMWRTYLENYLEVYGNLHEEGEITGVTTMNRARGCARYGRECCYCGIKDLSLRFSSPEIFWEEVRAGRRDMNANIFYEVFDSFSSAPAWIKKLVEAKPKDLEDARFFVYTQALETNPKLIELYKRLGVFRVNMGLDSGDDVMLRRLKGPRDSVEQNKKACELLRDNGIRIYASIVLGAPGENYDSLQKSIEFARWLVDNETVAAVESQPLWPEFNADSGKWLMDPDLARKAAKEQGFEIQDERLLENMQSKYRKSDTPEPDEIARDWASIFCEVGYDDLLDTAREIREYVREKGQVECSAMVKRLE